MPATVLFVGPTLAAAELPRDAVVRPPAGKGDVLEAVHGGATRIGLVDGVFETAASVWHKEILHALSRGVAVFGAASLGALRAAECHPFGMVGVGRIFADYRSGRRTADDDVAVTHAPAELGYVLLSEALVDIEATIEHMAAAALVAPAERSALRHAARALHFKQRTWDNIFAHAGLEPRRTEAIGRALDGHRIGLKRRDALEMIGVMRGEAGARRDVGFDFSRTGFFAELERGVVERARRHAENS